MGMKSLLKNNIITQEVGYFTAGQVAKSSTVLDMAGFDWACAIASYDTLLANGTLTLAAFGGDTSAAAATAYTAATVTYTEPASSPISNIVQVLEVCRPTKRYIKFTMTPGAANAVICCMIVLRGKGVMPVTQSLVTKGCLSSLSVVTPV
jgi:hypothetical protein